MDKRKLANIILKDLEETRVLVEEVAEIEEDSSLVIQLALNRGRLLCQEIELLQDLIEKSTFLQREREEVSFDTEEEEDSDIPYSDPELEILNFEERDFSVTDQMADEKDEEMEEDDLEEEEDDLTEEQEEDEEVEQEEINDDEEEEDDFTEEEVAEEELVEEEKVERVSELEKNIHSTVLKNEPTPGIREINIDDADDEYEIEPIRSPQSPGLAARPPMREIPKPEFAEPEKPEKMVVGEKYHKERSINDSIGENQSTDSKPTHNRIHSLRAAIGLNDRFQFIRDIFGNNSEKYNTVIEHLDKMEQIQEAVEYLKANLTMEKNEASMKFVELLKRRFPK